MRKYHNDPIMIDGIRFDSKKESIRYRELRLLQAVGTINNLDVHVSFPLIPSQKIDGKVIEKACNYIADFVYIEDGNVVVEDVKPFDKKTQKFITTPEFRIKKKLMLERHGIRVRLV